MTIIIMKNATTTTRLVNGQFFCGHIIKSHISTNLLTILGTRLSPMLTKAQAKQTWTDTRSNKSPSIMTLKIKNADQKGPGFADMDNTCSNDNETEYIFVRKLTGLGSKSHCRESPPRSGEKPPDPCRLLRSSTTPPLWPCHPRGERQVGALGVLARWLRSLQMIPGLKY